MSAHGAVYDLLRNDYFLQHDWGIDSNRVWPSYGMDGAPRTGYFLVLRWEETEIYGYYDQPCGPETLTVLCHRTKGEVGDFGGHKQILERVVTILKGATGIQGADGWLNQAIPQGYSGDNTDEIYGTLVKSAEFRVLSR